MFKFDHENPSKVVATATVPIVPDHLCDPMVWTPELKEFQTRRVFIVCTVNRRGRSVFRFYPLNKREDKAPPAFVIVGHDSPYLEDPTTHKVFEHKNFMIIRPLQAVYYKAKWALDRGDMDWLPANLLTLIKHCYFNDLVDDSFIDEAEKQFLKLENILHRAEKTSFEKEAEVCIKKAFSLCEKIFNKIKEVVKL